MTDSKSCADDGCMKMVEVRYDYSYKSDSDQKNVSFKVGEEYYLVVKTSENWWYVKKHLEDQQGVYVPAQYVKEVKTKKPKKVVPPISAPVSEGKPSLKSPPKLAQSKSQLDTTPSLNKGAIEELDKLLDDLKVPEAFQGGCGVWHFYWQCLAVTGWCVCVSLYGLFYGESSKIFWKSRL